MAIRDWTTGHRIVSAWLAIVLLASLGWVAGRVYTDRYIARLDRNEVCGNIGVALGDTVLRGVVGARRDSTALAERSCSSRYRLARRGRQSALYLPLAMVVLLSSLVSSIFSIRWLLARARSQS